MNSNMRFILISVITCVAADDIDKKNKTIEFPKMYINFDKTPFLPYPPKGEYFSQEASNQAFKVSETSLVFVLMLFTIPTIFLLIHLTRRISIDHNARINYYTVTNGTARMARTESCVKTLQTPAGQVELSDASMFMHNKWTNHISTANKLLATFGQDFYDEKLNNPMYEEYLNQRKDVTTETMRLIADPLEGEI